MRDLIVAFKYPHRLRQLEHWATLNDAGTLYVWCWGSTELDTWVEAPIGSVVTCLRCWASGPLGKWKPYGKGRLRLMMRDGVQSMLIDPEMPWRSE